ncbi:hypothetical protein LEM8419_03417 [Neolewinella maritima]|uniref:Conjugative transposon protein TraK n=1 Tax=Neolewinella maritima TaxID=1383882 RepID=A0ABN8FEA5_9BACT|nr:conjugative transposon protein TraK [Neolewinella maritima]CAH1002543.1 hypothetical protein LEM8419_03417 [Neolewinella maritima]
MLQSLNNMDKVFRQSRILTIVCVIGMVVVSLTSVSYVYSAQRQQSQIVYALIGENAVSLSAINVLENRPVEANNHVELFHRRLFGLDPDREVIDRNLNAALSMADNSVQTLVDAYDEDGYYRGLISSNMSQSITADSIYVDMATEPYYFRYTGELTITRPSSIATRSLISEGYFRNVQRSQLNPHGFLIEGYRVLANEDLRVEKRYN